MLGIYVANQTDDVELVYTLRQDPKPEEESSDGEAFDNALIAAIVVPIVGGVAIIVGIACLVAKLLKRRVKLQNMKGSTKEET